MKFCRICGKEMDDNARFCTNCGTAVETQPMQEPVQASVQEPVQAPVQEPVQPAAESVEAQQQFKSVATVATPETKKKKSKAPLIIGIVGGSILLLALLAVGIWYFAFRGDGQERVNILPAVFTEEEMVITETGYGEVYLENVYESDYAHLSYVVEDENVAVVNSEGVVTAIAPGQTVIRLMQDNTYELDTILVTVTEEKIKEYEVMNILGAGPASSTYGVYIEDLKNDVSYRWNISDKRMGCSALVNIPILYALNEGIEDGYLSPYDTTRFDYEYVGGRGIYGESHDGEYFTVEELVTSMARYSDNNCINSLLDYVGRDDVQQTMYDMGMEETVIVGGLSKYNSEYNENKSSAYELGYLFKQMIHNHSYAFGRDYLRSNYYVMDNAGKYSSMRYFGMGSEIGENFLSHNGITTTKYNEIVYVDDGTREFMIVFLSLGDGESERNANVKVAKRLAEYVYDNLD